MNEENCHIYEFGAFRLDPTARLLLRQGQPVALTPKVFDTLLLLVQRHGQLLEKEQLMKELWADSFVEESNLTYSISTLRKALGEKAADHRYIITVPGHGYRFAAEVREVEEKPAVHASESSALDVTHSKVKRNVLIAAGLLALIGFALLLWLARKVPETVPPPSPGKSIAVLPFKLVAGDAADAEMEYLSDGISESLINRLSQLPDTKVIARSSSFQYKGKEIEPQKVAQALGVEMILTGSVGRHNEQVQISVELMKASDKTQVWGEQYNRKLADLPKVQAEISSEIAEKLRLKLTNTEQQQLARRETVNPQAYELVLRGRFYINNKSGTENRKKAIEYFQQAIALDPAYALAYAELSDSYTFLASVRIGDPKEFTPKAAAAALKALELDDSLAEAHVALARVKMGAWEWTAAEQEFKRAIGLNPNLAKAHALYGFYLSIMRRHDEAIGEAKRARELDPLTLRSNWGVGYALLLARRNDAALETAKNTLELHQNFPDAYALLGYAYEAKGQYAEAIAAYQEAVKLGDHSPDLQIYFGTAYAKAGERETARSILKQLEAVKYVSRGALAAIYVALGEREQAFAALERAYAEHDDQLQVLGIDPHLDPLRSDPRFQDLLRRVGFTQ